MGTLSARHGTFIAADYIPTQLDQADGFYLHLRTYTYRELEDSTQRSTGRDLVDNGVSF